MVGSATSQIPSSTRNEDISSLRPSNFSHRPLNFNGRLYLHTLRIITHLIRPHPALFRSTKNDHNSFLLLPAVPHVLLNLFIVSLRVNETLGATNYSVYWSERGVRQPHFISFTMFL
uniref:Uncharacterized protein n=1 Tax=Caenorhabditis japonica TaxID=281687 RepID=A0A8R1ISL8_CAEJA